jgi:carbon-monoxide dehydrogenase large subunit
VRPTEGVVAGRSLGERQQRVEDGPLLRGEARFMADLALSGSAHAAFVRSPHAHALIAGVRRDSALAIPGVHAVLLACDLPHRGMLATVAIEGLVKTPHPALAGERVRFAGEPVAIVVAASRALAEDGAEAVEVDYEPLDALATPEAALAPGAPLLHPELGTNELYRGARRFGDPDRAFRSAHRIFRKELKHNRYLAAPMECRGCAASWDAARGELEVWASTQSPHLMRSRLAWVTGLAENRIRVRVPAVGGGFGLKIPLHAEEAAVALAARALGRTVTWIEDRQENLTAGPHAKDQRIALELAVAPDGTFAGLRARCTGDAGAYSFNAVSALIEPYLAAGLMPGPYRIRDYAYEVVAVATNKSPVTAYRGVGWTAGHTVRELLIDEAARALEIDPAELRRRNLVRKEEFPYESCTGMLYDSGSYLESLERALDAVDYASLREEQARRRASGTLLGIGISPYVEPTGWGSAGAAQSHWSFASHDVVRVTVEPDGGVTVATGSPSQGQGHATTLAQVVAEALGIDTANIAVVSGDTASTPISTAGTRASRTAVVNGGALTVASAQIRTKLFALAEHLFEASAEDLELRDGGIGVKGVPSSLLTLHQLARAAHYDPAAQRALGDPSLTASAFYDPPATYANGCILAVVEVDAATGGVRVHRIVAVEDCGTMINPAIVDGQVRGAVAQGIGGALLEEAAYGDDAQFRSGTFVDYLLPTAAEVPRIEVLHCVSPSPFTHHGIKGVGESGLVATPAAVASAVADALAHVGAKIERLPLKPEDVLRLACEEPA